MNRTAGPAMRQFYSSLTHVIMQGPHIFSYYNTSVIFCEGNKHLWEQYDFNLSLAERMNCFSSTAYVNKAYWETSPETQGGCKATHSDTGDPSFVTFCSWENTATGVLRCCWMIRIHSWKIRLDHCDAWLDLVLSSLTQVFLPLFADNKYRSLQEIAAPINQ